MLNTLLKTIFRNLCYWITHYSVRFADDEWNQWVDCTNTTEKYKEVVTTMFSDGIVNQGRLLVLEVFTTDVHHRYPAIAEEVQNLSCIYKILVTNNFQKKTKKKQPQNRGS